MEGLSTLLIIPTGWPSHDSWLNEPGSGKSLVYQLSSIALGGLVLVISPLISLMNDQLSHLPYHLKGASLSGKQTVWLHSQICTLTHFPQPQQVERVLVDVKVMDCHRLFVLNSQFRTVLWMSCSYLQNGWPVNPSFERFSISHQFSSWQWTKLIA